jgi:multiple antibiotic resistance protein
MQIFTFLFLMLGPFKIIGPYAKMTQDADRALSNKLALRAMIFSTLSVLLAALLGNMILKKFIIPVQILAFTGGLILFLVALLNIIKQFSPPETPKEKITAPTMEMAIYPLAFPIVVTPYGIAAVMVFTAVSPDLKSKFTIGAIVMGIMAINLVLMLITRYVFKYLAIILVLLGAILGVIQVALGFMFMYNQFRSLLAL